MANWFPSIWKAICTTRSWKNDEKRRYFNADMGIAVCPLSNSRTFWPFELTSDRRVSPILPISTLPSPNQGSIHKRRPNLSLPFLCSFCSFSMSFLWTFYHLKSVKYVSPILPLSTLLSPKQGIRNLSKRRILNIWKQWSAKIWLSKWFFYGKNYLNFLKFFF